MDTLFVFIVGIGYYGASTNLNDNHYSIYIGIIGKLYVFLSMTYYYKIGSIGIMIWILTIGYSIWTCLFIEFLLNYTKSKTK